MILLLDIGNSNIVVSISNDNLNIVNLQSIVTNTIQNINDLEIILFKLFELKNIKKEEIKYLAISCVVERLIQICNDFAKKYGIKIFSVSDAKINIKSSVENFPNSIDNDILCDLIGGINLFKNDFIIVDMGTTTTFNVVDKNGVYIGYSIVPGINTIGKTMSNNYELLSEYTRVAYQPSIVGKNKGTAIIAGIFYGYIGIMREIIKKIKKDYDGSMIVCLTGGLSNVFISHCNFADKIIPNLTTYGLFQLFLENNK